MGLQITFVGDDEDEILEMMKAWLEKREPAPEPEETEAEEEQQEEEAEEEQQEEAEEEADPMQELRDKLVEKIQVMSKKPSDINKIREAFKKSGIKKFDDNVPDRKLAPLAKLLGVK